MLKFIKAIRPINLFIVALMFHAFLLLEYQYKLVQNTNFKNLLQFELYLFSIISITAAGYLINDYFDESTDKINVPEKAKLPKRHNLLSFLILGAVGIITPLVLQLELDFIAINIIALLSLWFYSFIAQKIALLGNIIVASLTGILPILYLAYRDYYSLGSDKTISQINFTNILYLYSALAFINTLFREIVKDIEDLDGDKLSHYKTLPLISSVRTSKVIALIVLTLSGLLLFLFFVYFNAFTKTSMVVYSIFSFMPLLINIYLLIKSNNKEDFRFLSKSIKISMLCSFTFIISHALTI